MTTSPLLLTGAAYGEARAGSKPPDERPDTDSSWWLGVLFNLLGSVAINLGTNLMRLGHLRATKRRERALAAQRAAAATLGRSVSPGGDDEALDVDDKSDECSVLHGYLVCSTTRCCQYRTRRGRLSKTWIFGFIAFVLGNALNFFSFSYAAQSLLASLGSVQFITNVVFARIVLRETLSLYTLVGTLVLIMGVCVVVAFSCHGNPAVQYSLNELIELFVDETFLIYLSVLFVLWFLSKLLVARLAASGDARHVKLRAVSFAAVSAIIGSQSVTFFKILSELISIVANVDNRPEGLVTKHAVFTSWFTYLVLLCSLATSFYWVYRLNLALRLYDTLFIVPVFQVLWVTLSVVGGGIFFHEFETCFDLTNGTFFLGGLLTIFGGVFLLSPSSSSHGPVSSSATISPSSSSSTAIGVLISTPPPATLTTPLLFNTTEVSHHHLAQSPSSSFSGTRAATSNISVNNAVTAFASPHLHLMNTSGGEVGGLEAQIPPLARTGSMLDFGFAVVPVVDAVESHERRTSSGSGLGER